MADEPRLLAVIDANTKAFENALKRIERSTNQTFGKADQSVRRLEKSLHSSSQQLIHIGRATATAFGAGFLVGEFAELPHLIGELVHQAAGLVNLADKIGITTDALQELRFQAEQNGSSTTDLDAALEQFNKRIGLAATGSGELLRILTANGIALRDNAGNQRPLNDLLADYADLIKNAANESDRAVLAQEGFKNLDMASVFAGGADAIARFGEEAQRAGQVVGGESARALKEFEERIDSLKGRWSTFWTEATVVALQALETIGAGEHLILDPVIDAAKDAVSGPQVHDLVQEIAELEAKVGSLRDLASTGFFPDIALDIRRLDALKGKLDALRAARADDVAESKKLDAAAKTKDDRVTPTAPTIIPPRGPQLGGGGHSAADDIERQKKAVTELIAELQRELSLVGESETTQRISNELRQAGATATDEQKAQIAQLVAQIATEEEAQNRLIDTLDEIRDAAGGALSSFNSALRDGQGLAGGLRSALESVLDTVIRIAEQRAIESLFGAFGTAGGGGGLGSIIGRLFGGSAASATSSLAGATVSSVAATAARANRQSPAVVQLVVGPGQLFEPTVVGISGAVAVHTVRQNNRGIPAMIANRQARGI